LLAVVIASGGPPAVASASPAPSPAGVSVHADASIETVRGAARTFGLSDGGFVVTYQMGAVLRHTADGRVLWSRDSTSLYRDWQVKWQDPSFGYTPEQAWGSFPANPLGFAGQGNGYIGDLQPDAVGDLTGDGVPDVVTADLVGATISTVVRTCTFCVRPFDVPGSSLHVGTFVTVLDGRTGRTDYSELLPGYVTQLAIAGGRLLVGNETGDPQNGNGLGQWDSFTTVQALHLVRAGGSYRGRADWTFSTHAKWAHLFGVVDAGHGDVAAAWSDTPDGLGVPGPPDGHLVLLDARNGHVHWDQRTPGYPVLIAPDQPRDEVVMVQMTDPTQHTSYTVDAVQRSSGKTVVASTRDDAAPLSLAVTGSAWVVGAVDADIAKPDAPETGRVSMLDPATGHERWSTNLAGAGPDDPAKPAGLVVAGGTVFVASWVAPELPSLATPRSETDSITALSFATGARRWQRSGDTGDALSLSAAPHATARAVTDNQVVQTYTGSGPGAAVAEQGDVLSTASVGGNLIAGDQSGAVYSYDGKQLTRGVARLNWQTRLPGPVHVLQPTQLDGRPIIVAAATNDVAVVDANSGRVRTEMHIPGAYVWTAAVGDAGSQPAVFVPGERTVAAYSLRTGAKLWSYTTPAGTFLSNAAFADGNVVAEYTSPVGHPGPMASIGLDAATGHPAWTVPADPDTISHGQPWNGVVASPDIPGASGHGVALAWTNTDGEGVIEVRDARTGALDYSDTGDYLDPHSSYVTDPSLGLIAVGSNGTEQITPQGAEANGSATGRSGTVVPMPGSGQALLLGNEALDAYPTSFGSDQAPVATDDFIDAASVRTADLGAGPEAVATGDDPVAYQIVSAGAGLRVNVEMATFQHELALVSLTPGGDGARAATPRAGPTTGPAAVGNGELTADPDHSRSGEAHPMVEALDRSVAATPYPPSTMKAYLGLHGQGAGQTIAIVDAYHDPNLVPDAEVFSRQFGLPGVCGAGGDSKDCFTLDVTGSTTTETDEDWSLESSLDVEWAHAMAPQAHIVVVQADTTGIGDLLRAVGVAQALHPTVVSESFGLGFEFTDETYYDGMCPATGAPCVVSSGDDGHPGDYPAYNPSVIAVGGTTLTLNDDGTVADEQAWSGSGGGRSYVERAPAVQRGVVPTSAREMPDVSFDADPQSGVGVYDSFGYRGQSGWFQVGGTSLGAPVWAALFADADQLRAAAGAAPLTASAAQHTVYAARAQLADITAGPPNGLCPAGCRPGPGFDDVTGLGSPRTGIDAVLAGVKK
jgi:hypothetical protein